ncbi:MAG: type II toxin-antitoxin system RelE/ParE family toxin [Bryobacteraceae bacterium]
MSRLPVFFHPEAVEEVEAAVRWYGDRSTAAASRLVQELTQTIDRIAEAPERWMLFESGTRRFALRRFPFFVVYRVSGTVIEVLAVAHARRRPGYWRKRTEGEPDREMTG